MTTGAPELPANAPQNAKTAPEGAPRPQEERPAEGQPVAAAAAGAAPAPAAPAAAPPDATKKAFFATLPGIITAVVGGLTALTGLITALNQAPWVQPKPTATPTATVAPSSTSTPVSRVVLPAGGLLMDDFSDPNSGWEVVRNDEYSLGYSDGQYRMYVVTTDYDVLAEPLSDIELTDFSVEVEAQQLMGPAGAMCGLMVRVQPERCFYTFAINGQGAYIVERSDDGDYTVLVKWTDAEAIKPAGEVNLLRVDCLGSSMRFFVNGTQVCELVDRRYASGGVGLLASTFEGDPQDVRFDNLQVRSLLRFR